MGSKQSDRFCSRMSAIFNHGHNLALDHHFSHELLTIHSYYRGMEDRFRASGDKSVSFGRHSIAVLSSTMIVSTLMAIVFAILLFSSARDAARARELGMTWVFTTAMWVWLATFLISLPSAGLVLSSLWPVTRRGNSASRWICVLACTTVGMILAPGESNPHHVSLTQLATFTLCGAAIGIVYMVIVMRHHLPSADHVAHEQLAGNLSGSELETEADFALTVG